MGAYLDVCIGVCICICTRIHNMFMLELVK